jgi:hypothetical protein
VATGNKSGASAVGYVEMLVNMLPMPRQLDSPAARAAIERAERTQAFAKDGVI